MSATLRGRTCMVTGATGGVGKAAAMALAKLGCELILVGRDPQRGEATVEELMWLSGNPEIELLLADFGSQRSMRQAAQRFLQTGRPLHVLLNNAGAIFMRREETEDGIEATFAVNHLGYFMWTNLLLPRLLRSAPARIVNVASRTHSHAGPQLDFDDLESRNRYAALRAYGKSKLGNLLFTRELARRLDGTGVTVNALHPGLVASDFGANNGWRGRWLYRAPWPFSRSPRRGADTPVYLCSSPDVEGVSGAYFINRREVQPAPCALRDADGQRLWEISSEMTGVGSWASVTSDHPAGSVPLTEPA